MCLAQGCYHSFALHDFADDDPPNFRTFAEAARAGNPNAALAFNPGQIPWLPVSHHSFCRVLFLFSHAYAKLATAGHGIVVSNTTIGIHDEPVALNCQGGKPTIISPLSSLSLC